ncbi:iron transporter [Halapricum salinum]|uniref:DUF7350 domain-containing protein n=1 Tax=Halapricum salinum TaxID=1457250 RepID=A0A4D6HG04_9EURY|nr:iron transporter [Halapricum salinum]QCC51972.1 hypothetical protein DV733_12365 [Halapricum salinum]
MRRRAFLGGCAGALSSGLAGCGGLLEERSTGGQPPVLDDRPDAVYVPTHIEGMEMQGMQTVGDRKVGLFYSYAHRFWTVTGTRTNLAEIQDGQDVHLMASTWDPESGTVIPVLSQPTFTISQDGEEVDSKRAWPMLSQNMGFHFGENMALDGDGTYTVEVEVGAVDSQRVGDFDGTFGESITAEFEMEYSESTKNEIRYERLSDEEGTRGAVSPMSMEMLPLAYAPSKSAMPGSPVEVGSVGDAEMVATVDGSTLLVSPRTPYNRFAVPGFALSATLDAVGFDDTLTPAIGPEIGSHYRAELSSEPSSGDELTITVDGPPSIARHEGYETAFLERGSVTTTL